MARMPGTLDDARRSLVEANIGLVEHIATRVVQRYSRISEREELVLVGMLGLVEAASRFEPSRGIPFSTYAGMRIEGSIIDEMRRNDRLTRSARAMERTRAHVEQKFVMAEGRRPTRPELAEMLDLSVDSLDNHVRVVASSQVDSLDRPVRLDDVRSARLSEVLPDESSDIEAQFDERELVQAVRRCLGLLDARLRYVVIAYLIEGRPLQDIADHFGVTRSRVSQLKDEAVRSIRTALAEELGEASPPVIEAARAQAGARRRGSGRRLAAVAV
jgi:RNA polymerase sigma factor for flagellar operon FliA